MAEVTISGHIDQALTSLTSTAKGGTTYAYSGLDSLMSASYLTFAGTEDINGLKASFKIETGLNMNNSNAGGGLFAQTTATWNGGANASGNNREAWAGIGADFGDIKLGTQYTPLFLTAVGTDPAGANNAAGWLPFYVIFGNGAGANNNAVTYTSPSFNGITFSAQSVSGATINTATTNAQNGYGYSLNYAAGPLTVGAAVHSQAQAFAAAGAGTLYGGKTSYSNTHDTSYAAVTAGDQLQVTAVAVIYDLGVAKVSYLNLQGSLNSDTTSTNTGAVSVPFGAMTFGYSYSTGSLSSNASSSSTSVSSTGQEAFASYAFSKRTSAYLSYNQAKNTTYGDQITTSGIGIQHSF